MPDSLQYPPGTSPMYEGLMQYLRSRKAVPQLRVSYLPDGVLGRFEANSAFGKELPPEGVLHIGEGTGAGPSEIRKTLAHELAHAAERQLTNQYFDIPRGERSSNQFGQAMQKLVIGDDPKLPARQAQAAKLAGPGWVEKNRGYRASGAELSAFGAGSTEAPNRGNPAPQHVDPTMATELAILLELASRQRPAK